MPHIGEIKKGQTFQDGTGLRVRVKEKDATERVHFAVIQDRETIGVGAGEMSSFAFLNRFTRINSVEDACARIRHLGYVACRCVRIYGEEFELLSDPFPQADQIAIRAKAKSDARVRILRLPVTIVRARWQRAATGHSLTPPFQSPSIPTRTINNKQKG